MRVREQRGKGRGAHLGAPLCHSGEPARYRGLIGRGLQAGPKGLVSGPGWGKGWEELVGAVPR